MAAHEPEPKPALSAGVSRDWGEGEGSALNWALLKHLLGYVAASTRRHPLLAGALFVSMLAFTVTAAMFMPSRYVSQAKLLAHRDQTMAALGNPHRAFDWNPDGPTSAAYETLMARDNLISLIQQNHLIEKFKATRNPLLRAKDWVVRELAGSWNDERELEAMIGVMQKWLTVETNGANNTFTISMVWPEPQMARQLVDTAQRSFLETRHIAEVTEISETISILSAHQAQADERIEAGVREVVRVVEELRTAKAGLLPTKHRDPARAVTPTSSAKTQEAARSRSILESKKQALADLEQFRRRRVAEVTAQLSEQRAIFAANHPVVIELQQQLALVEQRSPVAVALEKEVADLEAAAATTDARPAALPAPRHAAEEARQTLDMIDPTLCGDPLIQVAQDQLQLALGNSQELQLRADAARLELDLTRAAFKYRYSVVNPALTPREPESPKIPLVLLGGLLMAVVISLAGTCGYDLARRRVLEAWQIETTLKLKVLAELKS